jgi:modulator of FtsH protease HflK
MPWNKDDGDNGGKGPWGQGPSNNQGPWGQGNRDNQKNQNNWGGNRGGGGGGGNLPPDLDDLVRRGKDSIKNIIPGGGGRAGWLIPIAILAAMFVFNSIHQVQPDEKGVVMRLGKYNRTVDPGLQFAIWPIERMEKPKTGTVRQINIGNDNADSSMLTSDKNIINVPFSVFWRIDNPKDFLYEVADAERVISTVSQSAMREVVGQTRAQPLLTTDKDLVAVEVRRITQELLNEYKAGVVVTNVNLGDVQPPTEVRDAFDEVVRAGQNQQQLINQAEQYRNEQLQIANGEAAKLIEDANGYKARTVAEAEGEASRFLSVYEQYKNAKDVTRERLFLEMMEQVLARTNKIVIEGGQGGSGVVPYLPLPSIQNRPTTPPAAN